MAKLKRDLENQIRGLLKIAGLVISRARDGAFVSQVKSLTEHEPELRKLVMPLLDVCNSTQTQLSQLDKQVRIYARDNKQVRAFMTVPGIGPITALAFLSVIDDPGRFKRSRDVVAYLGLTPRRFASGDVDWTGRISKCGNSLLRSYLFEATGVLLTRVDKWCSLKSWG